MAHIHENRPHFHFRPYNVGRWVVWGAFALVLIVATEHIGVEAVGTSIGQGGRQLVSRQALFEL